MTITCNADLFRLTYMSVSTEETRYYLNGVLVEPNPNGGVNLVATDGHRMIVIYDADGHADEPQIVKLSKDALKACKPKRTVRGVSEKRYLSVSAERATVTAQEFAPNGESLGKPLIVAMSASPVIDGTFPDYKRVIPTVETIGNPGAYNPDYVADFSKLCSELPNTKHLRLVCTDEESPALVIFPGCDIAFGVLMPMRARADFAAPTFLQPKAKPAPAPTTVPDEQPAKVARLSIVPASPAPVAVASPQAEPVPAAAVTALPPVAPAFKIPARFLATSHLAPVNDPLPVAPSCVVRLHA